MGISWEYWGNFWGLSSGNFGDKPYFSWDLIVIQWDMNDDLPSGYD